MPARILRLWNAGTSAWEEVGDSRLTAHLAAGDPHPVYLTTGEGDARYAPIGSGGTTDVTVTTDASLTSVESPANTFALAVRLSPDAGNALALRANGLFGTDTAGSGGGLATDPLADAKGDLFAASGNNAVGRLAVGTTGQVLTADPGQPLGVLWTTPASGGMANPMTTKGDLIGTTGITYTRLNPVGGSVSGANLGTAALTYDGDTGTSWFSNQAASTSGQWLQHDLGAALAPVGMRLLQNQNNRADRWRLESSADGATGWTTVYTSPTGQQAVGDTGVIGITPPAAARYWRWYTLGGGDGQVWIVPEAYLYSGTASNATRLPVGTDGQVLTADSTQTLGLRWAAGPSGSFLPLAGGTLTGDLVLSEATPTVSLKQAADTQPRSRLSDTALAFGPGGNAALDTTLQRTAAGALRVDTNLGVGVNPGAWGAAYRAVQVGGAGSVTAPVAATGVNLTDNSLYNGTTNIALLTGAAGSLTVNGGGLAFSTAPSVAAGAAQTFTERLAVNAQGTLSVTPVAGQPALVANGSAQVVPAGGAAINFAKSTTSTNPALAAGGAWVEVAAGAFTPSTDNGVPLGWVSNRWTAVYAVAGSINTSSAEMKQDITPLDPAAAMAAVRATDPVVFDYRPPERTAEWYELPDDPEQAQAVLQQRLTAAPLEAAARHQAGFVLDSDDYATDPLFETGAGQSNAANSVGVLLAALHDLDQRLTALEEGVPA